MNPNDIYNQTIQQLNELSYLGNNINTELTDLATNAPRIADDIKTAILARNNNLKGVIEPASEATSTALTARNPLLVENVKRYNNPFQALSATDLQMQPILQSADTLSKVRDLVAGDINKQTAIGVDTLNSRLQGLQSLLNQINQNKADAMNVGNFGLAVSDNLFNREQIEAEKEALLKQQKLSQKLIEQILSGGIMGNSLLGNSALGGTNVLEIQEYQKKINDLQSLIDKGDFGNRSELKKQLGFLEENLGVLKDKGYADSEKTQMMLEKLKNLIPKIEPESLVYPDGKKPDNLPKPLTDDEIKKELESFLDPVTSIGLKVNYRKTTPPFSLTPTNPVGELDKLLQTRNNLLSNPPNSLKQQQDINQKYSILAMLDPQNAPIYQNAMQLELGQIDPITAQAEQSRWENDLNAINSLIGEYQNLNLQTQYPEIFNILNQEELSKISSEEEKELSTRRTNYLKYLRDLVNDKDKKPEEKIVFIDDGTQSKPYSVTEIIDSNGNIINPQLFEFYVQRENAIKDGRTDLVSPIGGLQQQKQVDTRSFNLLDPRTWFGGGGGF